MVFGADHAVLLDRLEEELRIAPEPTRNLFDKIIGSACNRVSVLSRSEKASQLDRLITSAAWTDAALALIEIEMPAWKLRRLICENGEWFCSLSRQPNLPAAFDNTADASHDVLPLAILLAFLQARRMAAIPSGAPSAVPSVRPILDTLVCCDNFS